MTRRARETAALIMTQRVQASSGLELELMTAVWAACSSTDLIQAERLIPRVVAACSSSWRSWRVHLKRSVDERLVSGSGFGPRLPMTKTS